MITKKQIRDVIARLESYPPPVLSMYLNVNPAAGDRSPRRLDTRAKSTLDAMGVPRDLADRILLTIMEERPRARALAVFARPEPLVVETLELPIDIGFEDPQTGHGAGRWGEPLVGPLLAVLDENEHHGVLYVDRDHWRFFHVSFQSAEEVEAGKRTPSPGELDDLFTSKTIHPAYIPDRGSAGRDDADAHVNEGRRRFFQDVAARVERLLDDRELGRLILIGPDAEVRAFEPLLTPGAQERVVARAPGLSNPRAPASEVPRRLHDTLERLRAARERELLDEIGERGIKGKADCLRAWQNGQLRRVAVPWAPDGTVYKDPSTGYVAGTAKEARAHRVEGAVKEILLADALPDLATAYNVELEFVRGENKERLLEEFGGMGALRRW